MTTDLVRKRLNSIGKRIFVKYYFEFKNQILDMNVLSEKLLTENSNANSLNAQKTRISNARSIFRDNQQKQALQLIIQSEKIDSVTLQTAKNLYSSENEI